MSMHKKCEILFLCSQDIDRNRNSDVNQGRHNSVTSLRKMMRNNPDLDLVNMKT